MRARLSARSIAEVDYSHVLAELLPNRRYGGKLVFITGAQGSGKTTLMAKMADALLPKGVHIFWRGRPKGHVFLYSRSPKVVLVHEALKDIEPRRVEEQRWERIDWRDLGVEHVEWFSRPEELEGLGADFEHALMVVYMPRALWRKTLALWPKWRCLAYWAGFWLDEFGQIAPEYPVKGLWQKLQRVADGIAEMRKMDTYVVAASQQPKDVFFLVRGKFQYRIILPGTIVESTCRITQRAVDNLPRGWGFIVHGRFYRFPFKPAELLLPFDIQIHARHLF